MNPPKKQVDECGVKQDISSTFAKVEDKGTPPPAAAASSHNSCAPTSARAAQKCEEKENSKCPPMPGTDVTGCVPKWLCPPSSSGIKTYPTPAGLKIYPISFGRRKQYGYPNDGSSDSYAGTGSGRVAPKVNPSCPMGKPRCGETAAIGTKRGLFARIVGWFGIGK